MKAEVIRNRVSYEFWNRNYKRMMKIQDNQEVTAKVLLKIWEIIDSKQAFGSGMHAMYSLESLRQVFKDQGLSSNFKLFKQNLF